MPQFYLHYNGAAVFVKEAEFFAKQRRDNPDWDASAWVGPVNADGVNHARDIGEALVARGKLTSAGIRT